MRIASADGTLSEAITGLPEVNADGQGGLLGVTLDPSFSSHRMVYWTFSDKQPGGNLTAVGKGKLSEDEKTNENAQIISRATPEHKSSLHYGSRVLLGKTCHIIFSPGERSYLETRTPAKDL